MEYQYYAGSNQSVFVLLHGTGGSHKDLLDLARYIDKDAHIIALIGDVDEGGMKRFFKRKAPGVFDIDDLNYRRDKLYEFLDTLAKKHALKRDKFVAIGYSNGANLILSMLYAYKNPFKAIFLHHPMQPYDDQKLLLQKNLKVFVGAGLNDPICDAAMTKAIFSDIQTYEADIEIFWHHQYHQISREEIEAAKRFYLKKVQV